MRRVPLVPCEVLHTCARVLVHCYARHTAFYCDANNVFVHARAPVHRPQSRTQSFVRRSAKEVTSSSAELQLKGHHQTRIEQPTERGRNLASAPVDPWSYPTFDDGKTGRRTYSSHPLTTRRKTIRKRPSLDAEFFMAVTKKTFMHSSVACMMSSLSCFQQLHTLSNLDCHEVSPRVPTLSTFIFFNVILHVHGGKEQLRVRTIPTSLRGKSGGGVIIFGIWPQTYKVEPTHMKARSDYSDAVRTIRDRRQKMITRPTLQFCPAHKLVNVPEWTTNGNGIHGFHRASCSTEWKGSNTW